MFFYKFTTKFQRLENLITQTIIIAMAVRQLEKGEMIPYDLLLLADPDRKLLEQYLINSWIFVLEQIETIMGVCVLQNIDNQIVEIKNIAIDENYQNKGFGKFLLENTFEIAKTKGFEKIRIGTANSSIGQIYLYQKMGFDMKEIRKNFFVENYENSIFEHNLQAKHMIVFEKNL